jgi:uncharacterized membrane protein HdeD (DUF308 family)
MSDREYKSKQAKSLTTTIVAALAYIVLGCIMVFYPTTVNIALCYAIGGALTVYGLFNLITFFVSKNAYFGFELIVGIAAAAFGVFFLISPHSIYGMISTIIGILIIVDSSIDIKRAIQLKSLGFEKWWVSLLISLAVIVFSICAIVFHAFFANVIMVIFGIILVYEGASALVLMFLIGRFAKRFNPDQKMIEAEAEDIY